VRGNLSIRRRLLVGLAALACAVPAGLGAATLTAPAAQAAPTPVLVAVRAAHHTGYDRVVFEFTGRGPSSYDVGYTPALYADPAGWRLAVAGRAILKVTLQGVDAHTASGAVPSPARLAFAMPNVVTTVRAGDFEGVVTYGIGVARQESADMFRLSNPSRLVIDIDVPFRTVARKVWFVDDTKVVRNIEPPVTAVWRAVLPGSPAAGVMDRLYAGPTQAEKRASLRFVPSLTTEWYNLSISSTGVARVQLKWKCSSGGSTITVAGEIFPTLKQFGSVDHVKIYGPDGRTGQPTGRTDSIPECLEP
jgi:hypothetical protein